MSRSTIKNDPNRKNHLKNAQSDTVLLTNGHVSSSQSSASFHGFTDKDRERHLELISEPQLLKVSKLLVFFNSFLCSVAMRCYCFRALTLRGFK